VSVQFGRWNIDGMAVSLDDLKQAERTLAPYGPDGGKEYIKDNVGMLYRALHITRESRKETQPHVAPSGIVLTWDGRLDNRVELVRELGDGASMDATDVQIVALAFDEWGTACFARLIGDWALSLWDPGSRFLILAKDPIGARHLYYARDQKQIVWSTILDPLVLLSRRRFAVNEEYVAGWLSLNPAAHLTPYAGVHSVPPCSFVQLRAEAHSIRKYWDFDPTKTISYRTDGEYEEHFRTVFKEAIRRRLRSDSPVLAELSGGMDSSSIVCVADLLSASSSAESPRLDTISYYNDREASWNEKPFFSKVEEKRGRAGCHIDTSSIKMFYFDLQNSEFEATPACTAGRPTAATKQFAAFLETHGHRVVLSGIGGDEVMGGVPTPMPQLQDLLATARFRELARQLKVWALNARRPWLHLLLEALSGFLPLAIVSTPEFRRPASWIRPDFIGRHRLACTGYERRLRFFGPRPSFQANLSALETVRRQLACQTISAAPPYVKCYPYLDRSLLEFVYSIPREQLLRAGQRRSLMRRALVGIVPKEILERRRKAFVARRPRAAISAEWASLSALSERMRSATLGFVEQTSFIESLRATTSDKNVPLVLLVRTIFLEVWLQNQLKQGILCDEPLGTMTPRARLETTAISAEPD
jgi:asparagine synthase (glutamine-hydrolysing)